MKKSTAYIKPLLICMLFSFGISFANAINFSTKLDSIQKIKYFPEFDCDACGCAANGGSMGFSSMLNNNFLGLRYMHQKYESKQGIFKDAPWVAEHFNTIQLWSRIPITDKIQISALIPFHSNSRMISNSNQNIQGFGDATIMGFYTLYQTKKDSVTYTHKLQLGGGIKLPTGNYNSLNNGSLNPSFQLGTGSWDYTIISEYVVNRNKLGCNSSISYTLKTENEKYYKFGDQINYSSMLFYLLHSDKLKLVPQLGIAGEVYQNNQQLGQTVPDTKGDILFSKFGIEMGSGDFSLGLNTMLPISQNLTGGNVRATYRWSIHLNYTL